MADLPIAQVYDLGHKINVKYLLTADTFGAQKATSTSEFSRKDNIGRVKLENPTKDGVTIYFKDGTPPLEMNINQEAGPNLQVQFFNSDGTLKATANNNLELQAQFLDIS